MGDAQRAEIVAGMKAEERLRPDRVREAGRKKIPRHGGRGGKELLAAGRLRFGAAALPGFGMARDQAALSEVGGEATKQGESQEKGQEDQHFPER